MSEATVELRRVGGEIVGATVGAVEVEVGAAVPMSTWHGDHVWLKVNRFEESSLGPTAIGQAYDHEVLAPERFVGFMALPLDRVDQPRKARRKTGGRGTCGIVGCSSAYAGVRDAEEAAHVGLEVEATQGTVRLCVKHRRIVDEAE